MTVESQGCGHPGCDWNFYVITDSDSSKSIFQQALRLHLDKEHEGKQAPSLGDIFGKFGGLFS